MYTVRWKNAIAEIKFTLVQVCHWLVIAVSNYFEILLV